MPTESTSETASADGFKVLVVDDSAVSRKFVEQTLRGHCELLFAENGERGLALFAEHQPNLVITDWNMPDPSGIELCRRIRTEFQDDVSVAYTYLIFLTSNTEKEHVVEGLSAGADDYVTKPCHPDELLARVEVGRRFVHMHQQIEAKNRLLEELALTDSLTGLANRRAIEYWASRQISGAARHGFAFWVVLADLDNFKAVNDTHGHAAGDAVIKQFAAILRRNTRRSNICARVGGEEFMLVLTHANHDDVYTIAERIRAQCEATEFAAGSARIRITASFGMAGFHGASAPTFDELAKQADAALYAAKRQGRNRVCFAALAK
ncbi:MAG: diguanylate cyclase [Candidatus Acidiferrales bacterium]